MTSHIPDTTIASLGPVTTQLPIAAAALWLCESRFSVSSPRTAPSLPANVSRPGHYCPRHSRTRASPRYKRSQQHDLRNCILRNHIVCCCSSRVLAAHTSAIHPCVGFPHVHTLAQTIERPVRGGVRTLVTHAEERGDFCLCQQFYQTQLAQCTSRQSMPLRRAPSPLSLPHDRHTISCSGCHRSPR